MSDLNIPRFSHGCGVVKRGANEMIIVAGGVGTNLIELDSVEMYKVGVATSWTLGENESQVLLRDKPENCVPKLAS